MSTRANTTTIGLFVIGAIVLTVIGVATLASTRLFTKEATFISYFGESVNGLVVGAPVKFQGVPVGRVTHLVIQLGLTDKSFQVPVLYEIELSRLKSGKGTFVQLDDPDVLQQQIADGLRAQLQMESFVTGQLYVELSYRADAKPVTRVERSTEDAEIPTSPSLLAAFGTQAGSMVGDVLRVLFKVNEMLSAINMPEINRSVVASARAVERLANAKEIRAALVEVPALATQFKATLAGMQVVADKLAASIDPLRLKLEGTNSEVVLTLKAMQKTMDDTRGFISPDAGIGFQIEGAMASMKAAADALKALAQSLERNPDMLLRGKPPGKE